MKTCKTCGENKPKDAFYPHKPARDGLSWKCKDCLSAYAKEAYKRRWAEIKLRRILKASESN